MEGWKMKTTTVQQLLYNSRSTGAAGGFQQELLVTISIIDKSYSYTLFFNGRGFRQHRIELWQSIFCIMSHQQQYCNYQAPTDNTQW